MPAPNLKSVRIHQTDAGRSRTSTRGTKPHDVAAACPSDQVTDYGDLNDYSGV